jgi:hypothetical protein
MIASPIIRVAAGRYLNDDDSNTVTVLRVVHGRRRITGWMLGSA